jgi:hypothetical protein
MVSIFWPFSFTAPSLDSVPPVSVRVFESEHHSQHYTSGVHTTPPLQHPPLTSQPASQQYILDVHPTPPLQHPPAPPQPVQDQPHKIWPIPAQVSSSTTRTIDEPPRQNLQKSPATSKYQLFGTFKAGAVINPSKVLTRLIQLHAPLLSTNHTHLKHRPRHLLVAISNGTSGLMAPSHEFTHAKMPNDLRSMTSMSTGLARV